MGAVEILRAARDVLAKPGVWVNYVGPPNSGRLCIWQAVTAIGRNAPVPAYEAAFAHLRSFVGDNLFLWNDRPERTLEDVLGLCAKAIAKAESARERPSTPTEGDSQ